LLTDLADLAPAFRGSFRLGDGRTATFLSQWPVPAPYTYWMRDKPADLWVWACRGCGSVDDRWTWRDVDESTPMHRQGVEFTTDGPEMVDVPWTCPRHGCHGAPMWHRISAAA
jgi:hypothetical protein